MLTRYSRQKRFISGRMERRITICILDHTATGTGMVTPSTIHGLMEDLPFSCSPDCAMLFFRQSEAGVHVKRTAAWNCYPAYGIGKLQRKAQWRKHCFCLLMERVDLSDFNSQDILLPSAGCPGAAGGFDIQFNQVRNGLWSGTLCKCAKPLWKQRAFSVLFN